MGKINPKHKVIPRSASNERYGAKNRKKKKLQLFDSLGLPLAPGHLSEKQRKQIHTKYETILLRIEAEILHFHSQKEIEDEDVLHALVRILWERYPDKNPRMKQKTDLLTKIATKIGGTSISYQLEEQILHKITSFVETFISTTNDPSEAIPKIMWNTMHVIYDSCYFWMYQEDNSTYLDYIATFIDPAFINSLNDITTEGWEMIEQSMQKEKLPDVAEIENVIAQLSVDQQERIAIIHKSQYSLQEIKGYNMLSEAIYKFMTIDPLYNSNPSKPTINKILAEVEGLFLKARDFIHANVEIYNGLLVIYLYQKNLPKATKIYSEMETMIKLNPESFYLYSSVLLETHHYQQVLDYLNPILHNLKDSRWIQQLYSQCGYAHEGLQEIEAAIKNFRQALQLDPSLSHLEFEIAKCQAILDLQTTSSTSAPKIMYTNSFDFLELVSTVIHNLDLLHFQTNHSLQKQLFKKA